MMQYVPSYTIINFETRKPTEAHSYWFSSNSRKRLLNKMLLKSLCMRVYVLHTTCLRC
ncbi:hypothetical protein ERO13_A05G291150v2 [Gossypium hirsutum]|nr:hypothetical protein ERO13_A05G291150v2 [Gossypium hirsutum]